MIIEPAIPPPNSVRPTPETDRDKPNGRPRRDGRKQQAHDNRREESGPIPNDLGQMTGKLIDIIA